MSQKNLERKLSKAEVENTIKDFPVIEYIQQEEPIFWINFDKSSFPAHKAKLKISSEDIKEAHNRLTRFAPFIQKKFPETNKSAGLIESPFQEISHFNKRLADLFGMEVPGKMYCKMDSHLPIAGSVKARGGIYEVLNIAEELALESKLLKISDDYSRLTDPQFQNFYKQYTITVGSTGNLGVSIGLMARALGFQVDIHMSKNAKKWKKDLLLKQGVTIVEHEKDYLDAVQKAREIAENDPNKILIDDERSGILFQGYATAGERLKQDLVKNGITIDQDHPLFVYLPCGVGGSPGGITLGLKYVFGDNVHCFFVEPTKTPSMLLGELTQLHEKINITDFNMLGDTEADGLACNSPSKFVGRLIGPFISGIYTVSDELMFALLYLLNETEHINIEPSAAGSLFGPLDFMQTIESGEEYAWIKEIKMKKDNIVHVSWLTGGSLVPEKIFTDDLARGKEELKNLIKMLQDYQNE